MFKVMFVVFLFQAQSITVIVRVHVSFIVIQDVIGFQLSESDAWQLQESSDHEATSWSQINNSSHLMLIVFHQVISILEFFTFIVGGVMSSFWQAVAKAIAVPAVKVLVNTHDSIAESVHRVGIVVVVQAPAIIQEATKVSITAFLALSMNFWTLVFSEFPCFSLIVLLIFWLLFITNHDYGRIKYILYVAFFLKKSNYNYE